MATMQESPASTYTFEIPAIKYLEGPARNQSARIGNMRGGLTGSLHTMRVRPVKGTRIRSVRLHDTR